MGPPAPALPVLVLISADPRDLPPGVTVHHVPAELSWDGLLEEIFASDPVVAW